MENIRDLINNGKRHFENREYHQAESCLRKVIQKKGGYADVYNIMGVIAHADGRFASAIDHFKRALDINPNYTEAILNLAVLYNDLGQYADAKKLYMRLKSGAKPGATHIEPVLRGKLSNLHAEIGDIYRSIGLHTHAVEEYRKALGLNSNYFDIRTKLGMALRENGSLSESLKELKSVLREKKGYVPALVQIGITYYAMGKQTDAQKQWNLALKADSQNEHARMYLKLCEAMEREKKK